MYVLQRITLRLLDSAPRALSVEKVFAISRNALILHATHWRVLTRIGGYGSMVLICYQWQQISYSRLKHPFKEYNFQ